MNLTLQPKVLRWARDRARLDEPALAKKVGVGVERVKEWERTGQLTLTQAKKLAHVTHTPEGHLYLQQPPDDKLPIPDFRTVGNQPVRRPSPPLWEALRSTAHQRMWLPTSGKPWALLSAGRTRKRHGQKP